MITKLKQGDISAVHTGTYAGEMLIYIKSVSVDHCFLAIPTMLNRIIPKSAFEHARNTGIIKYVERAPSYVAMTSAEQYKKNENSNHRRQQPDSPYLLDSKEPVEKD